MGDILIVWTAISNRFGARMRTMLAQGLVFIGAAHCLRASLVSNLKMPNYEEALVDVAEIREIKTNEKPIRKRK